ncbi:MAG: hypothetical protein M3327_15380 [Actinomycetota bacterium]|nr:hypothetical protein [Actinomycetota bacterium]
MATQSTPPPPPSQYERPYAGGNLPPLPAPTSELVLYVLMLFIVGMVALISDAVGAREFGTWAVALTIGYLLSRGLAKLGKVFENP